MYLENNEVKKYPIRTILAWTSVVIWMAVIFMFSNQSADDSSATQNQPDGDLVRLLDSRPATRCSVCRIDGRMAPWAGLLRAWPIAQLVFSDMATPELSTPCSASSRRPVRASTNCTSPFGRAAPAMVGFPGWPGVSCGDLDLPGGHDAAFLRQDLRVQAEAICAF